jgi:hypothetical protein
MQFVNFDREKAARLKARYELAVACKEASFMFEGGEWLTGYAYYALIHLSGRLMDPSLFPSNSGRSSPEDKPGST